MNGYRALAVATLALGVAGTSPASAQDADSGWRFSVTPYLWLSGVSGDVTAPFPLPGRDVSADFGDLLDHLDGAFIGKAEVQYDRFGVLGDLLYLSVSGGKTLNPTNLPTIGTKLKLTTTTGTLAGFYRVHDSEQWKIDLLAGLRYNHFKTELNATAGGPGGDRSVSKDWTDPIIGVRARVRTGTKGSLTGYADYGGFDINDATVWQILGTYNYQWTDNAAVSVGYRYYVVDLKKEHFQFDLDLAGPLIGVTFTF